MQDFISSVPTQNGCVCLGSGKLVKYFKNSRKNIVRQAEAYCPVCHPNLAQPVEQAANEEAIEYEEFLELAHEGWKVT